MKKLNNKISIAGIFLFCTIVFGFVFVQNPLNLKFIPDGGDPPPPPPDPFPLTVSVTHPDDVTLNFSDDTLNYADGPVEVDLSWTPTTNGIISYISIYEDGQLARREYNWPSDSSISVTYQSHGPSTDVVYLCIVTAYHPEAGYKQATDEVRVHEIYNSTEDYDDDGLYNWEEISWGTNMFIKDTDEDGLDDGREVNYVLQTDPTNPDCDDDRLIDGLDAAPYNPDIDGDYYADGLEYWANGGLPEGNQWPHMNNTIFPSDLDNDGICDYDEEQIGTDPEDSDTDNDGFEDGQELFYGDSDPLDASSFPLDWDGDGVFDGIELHYGTSVWDPNSYPAVQYYVHIKDGENIDDIDDGDNLDDAYSNNHLYKLYQWTFARHKIWEAQNDFGNYFGISLVPLALVPVQGYKIFEYELIMNAECTSQLVSFDDHTPFIDEYGYPVVMKYMDIKQELLTATDENDAIKIREKADTTLNVIINPGNDLIPVEIDEDTYEATLLGTGTFESTESAWETTYLDPANGFHDYCQTLDNIKTGIKIAGFLAKFIPVYGGTISSALGAFGFLPDIIKEIVGEFDQWVDDGPNAYVSSKYDYTRGDDVIYNGEERSALVVETQSFLRNRVEFNTRATNQIKITADVEWSYDCYWNDNDWMETSDSLYTGFIVDLSDTPWDIPIYYGFY